MKSTISINISARIESRLGLSIWLSLPATMMQLKAALEKIYSYTDDYAVTGYVSTYPGISTDMLANMPLPMVNYLAARLERLDETSLDKLAALMQSDMRPQNADELLEYLQNQNCYRFVPYVKTVESLGWHYIYDSYLVDMPKPWKDAINLVTFGMNAAKLEGGSFTSRGYIARVCAHKKKKPLTIDTVPPKYKLTEEGAEQ